MTGDVSPKSPSIGTSIPPPAITRVDEPKLLPLDNQGFPTSGPGESALGNDKGSFDEVIFIICFNVWGSPHALIKDNKGILFADGS